MKKNIIIGVLSVCLTGVALLCLTGCATVRTEIAIDATPEEIWAVILDTQAYSSWNPVLIKAEGKFQEGRKITYQIKEPSGKQYEFEAKVKKIIPHNFINQRGGIFGILTYDHKYILEPAANGTKVVQHEDYRGVYVHFWNHDQMEDAYKKSNEALKTRVMELKNK